MQHLLRAIHGCHEPNQKHGQDVGDVYIVLHGDSLVLVVDSFFPLRLTSRESTGVESQPQAIC